MPVKRNDPDTNPTRIGDRLDQTVVELIEEQCQLTPDRLAVSSNQQELSYRELERRSNQFAHYLRKQGVGQETLVGICVQRSAEAIVALLGILKAGGAYVPLDPEHPHERVRFMLEDSQVKLLVTESAYAERLRQPGLQIIRLDTEREQIAQEAKSQLIETVGPEDLAYVIYTSGSTGKPKGVMIPHCGLVNVLRSMAIEPGISSSDVLLAVTTLSFDIAGLELYLPLTVGAHVFVANAETVRDAARLRLLLNESGATVMQATPATWRMLIESGWYGKRGLKILCGGEALPRDLADALLDRAGSVWNLYGPTETTIWSTVERVCKETGPVAIGRPIANTQLYILDEQGAQVPFGAIGELYIGGAGVARGYWKRPELTAERFVPDCFGAAGLNEAGPLLYCTGDEVRYRADGRIDYLGRKDNQVKIRGHRVELGEIEAALRQHPAVRDCVVTWHSDGAEPRLVAHIVPSQSSEPLSVVGLRAHLQHILPDYMLPSSFATLAQIPLTANSKVDRRAVAEASAESLALGSELTAPRTEIQRQLVSIFQRVLGVTHVSISDSFFDLGGHSLLAVRLFTEIAQVYQKTLPLATVFQAPTVERLAAILAQDQSGETSPLLVGIQTTGSLPPFFCVHSQGSSVLGYRALAGLLGPEQPFYGLQPRGLDGKSEPHVRIEEMAADYIQEIRKVQRDGPYYLGGVCLGGIIALEMAQQLRAQGQQVALVALIDSHFPGKPQYFSERALQPSFLWRIDRYLGDLLCSPAQALAHSFSRLRSFIVRTPTHHEYAGALAKVVQANILAERSYVPEFYPGRLLLFCCLEWSFRAYQDRRLAWTDIAGGVEVHLVPGNHRSMLEPPQVAVLAGKLKKVLQRCQSDGKISNSHGRGRALSNPMPA